METAYRAATLSLTSQRSPRPASDAGLSTAPRRSVGKPPLRQHAFALSDGKPFMHALLREARHADHARRSFVAPLPASPIPNIRQAAALAVRKIRTLLRYQASGRGRHHYDRTAGVAGGVWHRVGVRTQIRGPQSGRFRLARQGSRRVPRTLGNASSDVASQPAQFAEASGVRRPYRGTSVPESGFVRGPSLTGSCRQLRRARGQMTIGARHPNYDLGNPRGDSLGRRRPSRRRVGRLFAMVPGRGARSESQ
jgi:hypothetical protein